MKTTCICLFCFSLCLQAQDIDLITRYHNLLSHTAKVGSFYDHGEEQMDESKKKEVLESHFQNTLKQIENDTLDIKGLWDVLTVAHSEKSLESYEQHWGTNALDERKAISLSETRNVLNFLGLLGVPVFDYIEEEKLTPGLVNLLQIGLHPFYLHADSVIANQYLMRLEQIATLHPEVFESPFKTVNSEVFQIRSKYYRSIKADKDRFEFYKEIILTNPLPENMELSLLSLLIHQELPGGPELAMERLKFRRFAQVQSSMDILKKLESALEHDDYIQLIWHLHFYSKRMSNSFAEFFYIDDFGVERMK